MTNGCWTLLPSPSGVFRVFCNSRTLAKSRSTANSIFIAFTALFGSYLCTSTKPAVLLWISCSSRASFLSPSWLFSTVIFESAFFLFVFPFFPPISRASSTLIFFVSVSLPFVVIFLSCSAVPIANPFSFPFTSTMSVSVASGAFSPVVPSNSLVPLFGLSLSSLFVISISMSMPFVVLFIASSSFTPADCCSDPWSSTLMSISVTSTSFFPNGCVLSTLPSFSTSLSCWMFPASVSFSFSIFWLSCFRPVP